MLGFYGKHLYISLIFSWQCSADAYNRRNLFEPYGEKELREVVIWNDRNARGGSGKIKQIKNVAFFQQQKVRIYRSDKHLC